ncbi:MAG: MBL fold metallo-hydrolase [Nocardioidaceae bacterium]|jgi:glyoxylase-like metal-dependent hydrolase (beta-lactamase superfamily II)
MTYTGKVTVGGPSHVRELADLIVSKVAVGPMSNNAFLLRCRHTDEQLLIDAADDPATLLALVGAGGLARVVTTHSHADHWQGLAEVLDGTHARTVAGELDADDLPVTVDERVSDGDVVPVGASELRVIHLAGHTAGSIALLFDDPDGGPHLFTGDSLFPGGPGRTRDPASFTSLMDDLHSKVFDQLPDETWVYPGHGDDTTLGAERPSLPEWRARGW